MPRTLRTKSGTRIVLPAANDNLPEWRLQAEAVRRLRQHPDYGSRFTLAGDMNAARRGKQTATIAKATGMTAGEPDLRVYAEHGRLLLVEIKVGSSTTRSAGRLSSAQTDRHTLLRRLGYSVEVVWATSPDDCADQVTALVCGWLAHSATEAA